MRHVNAAWIGVIGVLGGVLLGAGVNLVGDRFRWKREDERLERDRVRLRSERRRELCIDLATATDELLSRLHTFAEIRSAKPVAWRSDEYAQHLNDAIEAVVSAQNRSYNELRIMGMGGRLLDAADRLVELSSGAVNGAFAEKKVEWWDSSEWGDASSRFLDAAHAEFGTATRGRRAPVARLQAPRPSQGG
jgi:hypothetical protein